MIVFPAWRGGAALDLQPQAPEQAFTRLAFNSFNYGLLGRIGFDAVADLAAACPAYQLTYSRLDEAVSALTMLGFSPAPSAKVVVDILKDQPDLPVEQVVKLALKQIK